MIKRSFAARANLRRYGSIFGKCKARRCAQHDNGKSKIEFLQYSFKLFQKPHIILEKQPYIVNPVFEHGGALNAQAKGIAGVFAAVNFAIFEHNGVNHAAAQYLNPARVLANRTATTIAENT